MPGMIGYGDPPGELELQVKVLRVCAPRVLGLERSSPLR
jgi:hypothetical protein